MLEELRPAPTGLLNWESKYIKSLQKEEGFTIREVNERGNPFNAIIYKRKQEEVEQTVGEGKSNLLMLYGTSGEAGATTHISATFLSKLETKVDSVMGFNSGLSRTSFKTKPYEHGLDQQAESISALYEGKFKDEKQKPVIIFGHSMGGTTGTIVAKKLLEEGYNVTDLVLLASPLAERSKKRMLWDFGKLGQDKRIYPDISILYPSPKDIAVFEDGKKRLSEESPLTPAQVEEKEMYELATQRQKNPDELILGNMSDRRREKVERIDTKMSGLVGSTKYKDRLGIEVMERKRERLLLKPAKRLISGKIGNERIQGPAERGSISKVGRKVRTLGYVVRNVPEILGTLSDLAGNATANAIQDLIRYKEENLPDRSFAITLIEGSSDPIPGNYGGHEEILDEEANGPTTVFEIYKYEAFDHFTLCHDPVRVAQAVDRIMDRRRAGQGKSASAGEFL